MALPALATTEQLAAWMQIPAEDLPASATLALDTVSAIVRAEARNSFVRSTSTVSLWPIDGTVTLPQRPVVSVDSVQRDGADVTATLVRDRLRVRGCEPVSVTFTYGYAEVPGDVLAIVLSAAQRVISNPQDLRQETVGSISVTYAAETIGAGLAQSDKDTLARYRRAATMVSMV